MKSTRKNTKTFANYEELEAAVKKSLIKHFTKHGSEFTLLNYFQIKKHDEKRLSVRLFTSRHRYCIAASTGGYLGCTYSNRTPLPGESWTRGRDLPDGAHSERTWGRIKTAILWEELVPLSKEVVSRLELQGIDTNNPEAKKLAELRREQAERLSECEEEVIDKPMEE